MEAGERGGDEPAARKVSVREAEPPSAPRVTPRTTLEWPRSSGGSGIPVGSVVHPFGALCAVPRAGTDQVGQSRWEPPPTGAPSL